MSEKQTQIYAVSAFIFAPAAKPAPDQLLLEIVEATSREEAVGIFTMQLQLHQLWKKYSIGAIRARSVAHPTLGLTGPIAPPEAEENRREGQE